MNYTSGAEEAAKRFEENMEKYPEVERIALYLVMNNVLNGCSWEFTRNEEIKRHLDEFAKNPNCSVQKVLYSSKPTPSYGYLVYMKTNYMYSVLNKEAHGLINSKDLEIASKHRESAMVELSKLMVGGFKGTIGIFCTNDSQSITIDGNRYKAFAVTLAELVAVCMKHGYGIVVNGVTRRPQDVLAREDGVLSKLMVAPSGNALLIQIAPL